MRYRSSSNCAGFVYMNELKSRDVCLCQRKTFLGDAPELVKGNKLGFETFTRLATYSKAEQTEIKLTDGERFAIPQYGSIKLPVESLTLV